MRKIKLDIDSLKVESFATAEPASRNGTVRGEESETMYTDGQCCTPPSQQPGDVATDCGETCFLAGNCLYANTYICSGGSCPGCTEFTYDFGCTNPSGLTLCFGQAVSCYNCTTALQTC